MSVELAQEANFTFGAETHRIADLQLLGRLYKSPPMRAVDPFVQRRLDRGLTAASPDPPARQTGRDDLAVVDDQAVTGAQLIRQVTDGTVVALGNLTGPHHQEPCGVPRRCRPQGNAIRRQVEIKQICAHGFPSSCPALGSSRRPARAQALCRASTFCDFASLKDVDGRDIGGRKHAVLQTAMPGHGVATAPAGANDYAPIVALTILSGSLTGSPRLIWSTCSMPSITLPQTVYWLLRKLASSKQMKNWLSPESGLLARAIDTVPRTWGSRLNSALSFFPDPPVPVPCGHPVCAMKPSITRWNTMPS